MKVLVMCSAGMSTSLLVNKMRHHARESGHDEVVIDAQPVDELPSYVEEYDIFLLGPQVQYKESWVKEIVEGRQKRYANIPMLDYGLVDGVKTLALAMSLR